MPCLKDMDKILPGQIASVTLDLQMHGQILAGLERESM